MKHQRLFTLILSVVSTLFALGLSEGALRFAEARGFNKFDHFRKLTHESFYFHHFKKETADPQPSQGEYDPAFGWRASPAGKIHGVDTAEREKLNSDDWRSPTSYTKKKSRPRVILIGDSYMYGLRLADQETIPARLQELLGTKYEVMNMSAAGYGLDQMALVATELALGYEPDHLVISFISDDLRRSCYDFLWDRKKPYFTEESGRLVIQGRPVPNSEELFARHRTRSARLYDALLVGLTKSRVLSLAMQPLLQKRHESCVEGLNAKILRYVYEQVPEKTRLHFILLDGDLPQRFEAEIRKLPAPFHSLKSVKSGTIDGMHPDPESAKAYASFIKDALTKSEDPIGSP